MRQADIPQNTVVRESTLKSTSFLRLPWPYIIQWLRKYVFSQ